jgi:hypothetical protein
VEGMFLAMVKKTMDLHVSLNLLFVTIVSTRFILWMSQSGMDTFVPIINFLNGAWVPMHVVVGLFKVSETTKFSKVVQGFNLYFKILILFNK